VIHLLNDVGGLLDSIDPIVYLVLLVVPIPITRIERLNP
jgi:hypothetical protein